MGGRRKKEWFDDDAFWAEMRPFMFPEQCFADAPAQIRKVLDLTHPEGKAALDLCCGPGRCAIALAQAGFAVTGVDRTECLLNEAHARASEAEVHVEWVQSDMRDFVRPEGFDLALSMFTSFGYFEDERDETLVLENVLTSLKPRGVFLIDVVGKEPLSRAFLPTSSKMLSDSTKLIERREICSDWTRIRNEWILIRKARAKSFRFEHTVYSGRELRDLMERAGFGDVCLFGSLDGDEYGIDAQRLIATGRKASPDE